jgi:hypothetical protein
MRRDKKIRAVSTLEYSIVVAVVVAALLGMQIYLKRAVCSRWRQAADTFGYGRQYQRSAP